MNKTITLSLIAALSFSACSKDDDETPSTPSIPSTYNFSNVSYGGQTDRLNMLAELTAEMKKPANGEVIDAQTLMDMYANENTPFADADLNASSKDLKSKTFAGAGSVPGVDYFEALLQYQAAFSSTNTGPWSPGTAGVATTGSKKYYFSSRGVEYAQLVEKGLMGAVFYYQIAETYTREGKIGDAVDNDNVTDGKGTDMEHHWDEAFGYFGAVTDLTEANYQDKLDAGVIKYHAKYAAKGSNAGLNTVGNVMDQFIKGRYGISNKNYNMRDAAAASVRAEYEKIMVTTAIHYLNGAASNFADDAKRNHELSEAYAFIISLYYNNDKAMTSAEIDEVVNIFKEDIGGGMMVTSFLQTTIEDITEAKDKLSAAYGLDSVKDVL
jgi:hypothetical protein